MVEPRCWGIGMGVNDGLNRNGAIWRDMAPGLERYGEIWGDMGGAGPGLER